MNRRPSRIHLIGLCGLVALGVAVGGCQKKTTRKMTVETPEKKYEVKVEKTEKK